MRPFLAHPFDDDKLKEECGVFGVVGVADASNFVALGLHALQHRGQEAGGIVSYHPEHGFNSARRFGYVRDNFTKADVMDTLPGALAIGHVRYSTAGSKGATAIRDVQPFFGEFSMGGCAIAHNGNITNAVALRRELIERGVDLPILVGQRMHHPPDGAVDPEEHPRTDQGRAARGSRARSRVVAMTRTKLIGVRDPLGVRPLVLGRIGDDGWALSSETCGLDIIGADFVREIEPGEMVVIEDGKVEIDPPLHARQSRASASSSMSISRRPDSILGGRSVYETRRQIGVELAREAPVEADLVCPVPDCGTPAAIGYASKSGIPYAMGIIRNQYMGRTFIEPTEQIRNMGVRLKLNVNRALIKGKRVILVDDSVVRGTTSRKIKDMILEAGAAEVHFRIASPPTAWPCFYGVDTPERVEAAGRDDVRRRDARLDRRRLAEVRHASTGFTARRARPQAAIRPARAICDACFSGEYPVAPSDKIEEGFQMKAAE